MNVSYLDESQVDFIIKHDRHINQSVIKHKISNKEIIVLSDDDKRIIGWLRFNYFWDHTPFMNMLFIEERCRHQGYGQMLVSFWENEMRNQGFEMVMTSTLSNEQAQHFYRKLGYKDSGCLLLEGEALEIIFTKKL